MIAALIVGAIVGACPVASFSPTHAGGQRYAVVTISEDAYPSNGVDWFVNGDFDRHDLYGPLDRVDGLFHSTPQTLAEGDTLTACWTSHAVNVCRSTTVRPVWVAEELV